LRGFEAASSLVGERIRQAGEKRGFAVARLLTHWAEIVGEDLARSARPLKVSYPKDGFGATLTILVTGALAPQIEKQKPLIKDRVNACYGYAAISRIALTQTAPTGFSEGRAEFVQAPAKAPPEPDPAIVAEARAAAVDVADHGLRQAIETLTRNFLIRTKT
jgi:hypothetical protein